MTDPVDTPDLEAMTRAELLELRARVDRAIASAGERDRRRALEAAEAMAQEHGFSLAELVGGEAGSGKNRGRRGTRSAGAPSPAPSDLRYRNPENPDQTWSGRGRRPVWFNEALAQGRSAEELKAG